MNKEDFSNLLILRNYEAVEKALKKGFDANTPLENDTPAIEWCSYTNDFRMMEILWKAGAKPTTPYVEEIIQKFENGKSYVDLVPPVVDLNDYPDLTGVFSVKKLEFNTGELNKQDNIYYLTIPISKFVMDNELIDTSIRLDGIRLNEDVTSLIGKTKTFPINPEEGYIDGSIYLRHVHNPVDVREIKFMSIEGDLITAEMDMEFLFEFEETGFPNERMKKIITFANTRS